MYRQAQAHELPELKQRLKDSGGEQIDLNHARVFVAVEGGKIVGMLPLRLVWQAEPLLVWGDTQSSKRRAGMGIYLTALRWLGSSENRTGIRWLFGITRKRCVMRWLEKLGWFRQYKGAATYLKYVQGE